MRVTFGNNMVSDSEISPVTGFSTISLKSVFRIKIESILCKSYAIIINPENIRELQNSKMAAFPH
jgi:hypothetical protein